MGKTTYWQAEARIDLQFLALIPENSEKVSLLLYTSWLYYDNSRIMFCRRLHVSLISQANGVWEQDQHAIAYCDDTDEPGNRIYQAK